MSRKRVNNSSKKFEDKTSSKLIRLNKEMIKSMEDVKNRVGIKRFNNAKEMLDDLNSDKKTNKN